MILSRSDWGATAPIGPRMTLPALGVFVHHSVTVADDDVASDMREIERVGVARFGRFPYSFCVHPSSWVAEGAGLTVGAHTADRNSRHFGICFIGNKDNEAMSDAELASFGSLCRGLVAGGHLVPDFFIQPHRAVYATACPGAHTIERWADLVAAVTATEDDDMTPEEHADLKFCAEQVKRLIDANYWGPVGDSGRLGLVEGLDGRIRQVVAEEVAKLAGVGATGSSDLSVDAWVDAVKRANREGTG